EQDSSFGTDDAFPRIKEILHQYGVVVGRTPPGQAVARIQRRPEAVREQLLAAVHECWRHAPKKDAQTRTWLIAVLNDADGNPWRANVRKAFMAGEWTTIEQLVRDVDVRRQPPSFLLWVAQNLYWKNGSAGLDLLQRIQCVYPADLWTNYTL